MKWEQKGNVSVKNGGPGRLGVVRQVESGRLVSKAKAARTKEQLIGL